MQDLIDRQSAIDAIENVSCSDGNGISALKCEAIDDAVRTIRNLPSAQPKVKSKWKKETKFEGYYRCPVCGRRVDDVTEYGLEESDVFPFCHCGADMRGDDNG